jgi:hypothetical protein
MSKSDTWLLDHSASTYSQYGEDGIVEAILSILPERDCWCVEFGAVDGRHLSNTRNLIDHKNYSAVLIEASKKHYKDLVKNYSSNNRITTINRFVGFKDKDNLDTILKDTQIPLDFDFLSIDIDGNDYHVWNAMAHYAPKIVCIEFNQTIPNEVAFIQAADPNVNQGSSLSALVKLGKEKEYELVCVTGGNAIFVRTQYFRLFEIENNSPENLRVDVSAVTHLFVGYDGTVFLRGQGVLPWHEKIPVSHSRIQNLPRFLRKYPKNYNKIEFAAFSAYLLVFHPKLFINAFKRKFSL